jgi:hypothetical protein
VKPVSAVVPPCAGTSDPVLSSFGKAAMMWLRFMAGIKQSGSLRKKGGSSNFIALLPVCPRNKAIKLSGARYLFIL